MTNGQQVLTSWKEIASYLGKGVRTVQRWESELGLPVRRPGTDRHIVLAFPAELDEWARPKTHRSVHENGNGDSISNPQPVEKIHLIRDASQSSATVAQIQRTRDLVHEMMQKAHANRERTEKLLQQCEKTLGRRREDLVRIA